MLFVCFVSRLFGGAFVLHVRSSSPRRQLLWPNNAERIRVAFNFNAELVFVRLSFRPIPISFVDAVKLSVFPPGNRYILQRTQKQTQNKSRKKTQTNSSWSIDGRYEMSRRLTKNNLLAHTQFTNKTLFWHWMTINSKTNVTLISLCMQIVALVVSETWCVGDDANLICIVLWLLMELRLTEVFFSDFWMRFTGIDWNRIRNTGMHCCCRYANSPNGSYGRTRNYRHWLWDRYVVMRPVYKSNW